MKVEFETQHGKFAFLSEGLNIDNVRFIGFVKDLTEEQWSEVVDKFGVGVNHQDVWEHYIYKDYVGNYEHEGYLTATESGKSLMDSLDIYLENPVPQPEVYYDPEIPMDSIHNGFYDQSWVDAYQEAEEKTGNWILIKYL
jgi:hypothetical protein